MNSLYLIAAARSLVLRPSQNKESFHVHSVFFKLVKHQTHKTISPSFSQRFHRCRRLQIMMPLFTKLLSFLVISSCIPLCAWVSAHREVVGWMYLGDQAGQPPPTWWNDIPFDVIDVLYIGPLGLLDDGTTFGVAPVHWIQEQYAWVMENAKKHNPALKIFVSHFWGPPGPWGSPLSELDAANVPEFAASVKKFLVQNGLDGYDIDYEAYNVVDTFDALSRALNSEFKGTHLQFSISPASTEYVDTSNSGFIDYVNMQSYAGGSYISIQDWTNLGITSSQIRYGMCPERDCYGPSVQETIDEVTQNDLKGVHVWRMDSDNYEQEWQSLVDISTAMHDNVDTATLLSSFSSHSAAIPLPSEQTRRGQRQIPRWLTSTTTGSLIHDHNRIHQLQV